MFKNKPDNTVLVVNDLPDQVELMKCLLEKSEYQVRTAFDGREGLNDARKFPPALIISDVAMPIMDGIELCAAIKADPDLFSTPVLLVSANRKDSDSMIKGLQAGADDYLEAPYDPLMLVVKVARLIVQKRAEEKIRESEAQYRSLAETATDVIVTVDSHGKIVQVNNSVERTFGYRVEELLGTSVALIMPDFLKQAGFISLVRKNLSDSQKLNWEPLVFSGLHKNGHTVPLDVSFGQFKQNSEMFHTGIARDITTRRKTEEALSESRSRLASIIESAMDAMITVDSRQCITIFNKAAELMFNCLASEAIGQPLGKFISGSNSGSDVEEAGTLDVTEITTQYMRGARALAGRKNGGEVFPIEASISQVHTSTEKLCTVILRDVTERKEAEEKLARSEERLRLAQQAGDIGVFDWDMRTGEVAWTEEMEALVGLSTGGFLGTFEDWRRYIHRDDLEQVDHRIQLARETRKRDWHQEYRLVRADTGDIRWMEVFGHIFLDGDGGAQRMVGVNMDITERKNGEQKLKSSEARLAEAQRVSHLGSWEWEIATQSGIWSDEMFRIIELEPDSEPLNAAMVYQYLLPGKSDNLEHLLRTTGEEEGAFQFEHAVKGTKGTPLVLHVRGQVQLDVDGKPVKVVGTAQNISELKKAEEALRRSEEQFLQAQKLDAIGQLAGGVAHDFNNLLTAIIVSSDLVLYKLNPADPLRKNIEEIKKAGNRASTLTRQLLAFSRRQVLQPQVLNINAVVAEMAQMLPRLIGENIELTTTLDPDLGMVKADPGQIEQVLLNLAVNSRDAMPEGGELTMETSNVDVHEDFNEGPSEINPGRYVRISVSDTGHGIDSDTQVRIFEPFFSTKEAYKGTGLGLSTVYGIIKQSGGSIWVSSELDKGTTFYIYLPRVDAVAPGYTKPIREREPKKGTETILLVEDEDIVRGLAREVLEMNGYVVLEADTPNEAIALCMRHNGPIDMLLTDVVMPQMSGRVLSERLLKLRPGLGVMFMSGYTSDAIVDHGVLNAGVKFIQKPFSPDSLAQAVRSVLEDAK